MPGLPDRHPADELGDIKAQIKALEKREGELRDILSDPLAERIGSEYEIVFKSVVATRLDTQAIRKDLGDDRLVKWLRTSSQVRVHANRIGPPHGE